LPKVIEAGDLLAGVIAKHALQAGYRIVAKQDEITTCASMGVNIPLRGK
jgi:hypothetical protein